MKIAALLALVFLTGACSAHPVVNPREFSLRLESDRTVCSATAVGPDTIETAAHCMAFPLATINGKPAKVVRSWKTGVDRLRVVVSGVRFDTWAALGKAKEGDHVRWWGQPKGAPFVLRYGYIAQVYDDGVLIVGTVCRGDSGSGAFNDAGELVAVVSAMTNENACAFVIAR